MYKPNDILAARHADRLGEATDEQKLTALREVDVEAIAGRTIRQAKVLRAVGYFLLVLAVAVGILLWQKHQANAAPVPQRAAFGYKITNGSQSGKTLTVCFDAVQTGPYDPPKCRADARKVLQPGQTVTGAQAVWTPAGKRGAIETYSQHDGWTWSTWVDCRGSNHGVYRILNSGIRKAKVVG